MKRSDVVYAQFTDTTARDENRNATDASAFEVVTLPNDRNDTIKRSEA